MKAQVYLYVLTHTHTHFRGYTVCQVAVVIPLPPPQLLEITSRLDRLEQQWSESIEEQSQLVASLQTALSEHSEVYGMHASLENN